MADSAMPNAMKKTCLRSSSDNEKHQQEHGGISEKLPTHRVQIKAKRKRLFRKDEERNSIKRDRKCMKNRWRRRTVRFFLLHRPKG